MLNKINMAQQKIAFGHRDTGCGYARGDEKGNDVEATMGDVRDMSRVVKAELRQEMVQMKEQLQKDIFEAKSASASGDSRHLSRPPSGESVMILD